MFDGHRGQAYTLEGIIASVILLSSLLYGLQAVDVAPWAGGTNDEQAEAFRTQARDVLVTAANNGTLRQAVTCVDTSGDPAPQIGHRTPDNGTALGGMLERAFSERGRSYNLYFDYWDVSASNQHRDRHLVYPILKLNPSESDLPQLPDQDAAAATFRISLYDDTTLRTPNSAGKCRETVGTFGNPNFPDPSVSLSSSSLYVNDAHASEVYNVVEVRLVVW